MNAYFQSFNQLTNLPEAGERTGWPWTEQNGAVIFDASGLQAYPKISIITSSFNRSEFIEETLRGVILQRYPNTELIVVDGASTDGTLEILKRYSPWITILISERDTGEYNAVNKGLRLATGSIITFNSSDDVYSPGIFFEVARMYRDNPEAGVFAGGFYRMNEHSQKYGAVFPATWPFLGPHDLSTSYNGEWRLHQQALFYRAEALDSVGRNMNEKLRYTGDRELLYRVCRMFPVVTSNMTFAGFRVHENSLTTGSATREMADREFLALQRSYFKHDGHDGARRKLARRLHAKIWVNKGRFERNPLRALYWLALAALRHPTVLGSYAFQSGLMRAMRIRR